jgi:Heparinase II/III-like protein/Heparinase II/III N-terminus
VGLALSADGAPARHDRSDAGMSDPGALTRLAAMDRQELRFRVVTEARKIAGRVRYSMRPPRWDRGRIVRILDRSAGPLVADALEAARRGDQLAAHRALGAHFESRASRWPLQASRRRALVDEILQAFPHEAGDARRRADRILSGRYDLLGHREVALGHPPDWHLDAVHARRVPAAFWASVPYLDPASGDHKVIWEINRHQYFCALGTAYWLTGDRRYRDGFVTHLEDWLRENPPLHGVNWSSMLELAFRTISWTWAVEFFCDATAADDTPWLVDLLVAIDRQLTHIAHNLSRYFSPNTHLSGEALALYVVSAAFPELRQSRARAVQGREILLREANAQVHADGGHAELSAHYHRYSTDFYLLATLLARATGDPGADALESCARRQSAYLRTLADDRGRLPLIGDDDGGQLFRFSDERSSDASVTLGVAASALGERSFAVRTPSPDVFWILGKRPEIADRHTAPRWPSKVFPESGYLISRTGDGGHLVFDAGSHGFLNGGHAHADALSVVLTVGGEPLLVDPGTATYTMDPEVRDRFRSSRMHNTLVLDERDHAEPDGPFHWRTRTDARFLVARTQPRLDFAVGTHDAYGAARHMRAVLAVHGVGWLIVDRVSAGHAPVRADTWWHLHPSWRALVRDGTVALRHSSGMRLGLASTAGEITIVDDPKLSAFAPEYGRVEGSTTVRARHAAGGVFAIATFIPASGALSQPLAIVEVPAERRTPNGWEGRAFDVHAGQVQLRIELAFPLEPNRGPDDWPQPCIEELNVCVE